MEIGIHAAPTVLKQNVTLFSRFVPTVKLVYQDHMVLVVLVKWEES
jgi:hypothetical protein